MPTTRARPDPIIPDHEVLRLIGGGAYGEVWLARGVTGALRAVKVLWREDFEDERTFEREFEGILKYEPISRDHPGLVNVLHVGRSPDGEDKDFYYYVMELGDDITTGCDINPIEYEARTLRTDMKMADGQRLDTGFCIDVGLRLAEALKNLHDQGLAHRDVKPANIIFVSGRAKLADIGLVAARGQRTFVGTEGFVPPEGPGSAPADVYSLGKVLYEMATGKDRLDFPEGPDELPQGPERKQWLALNHVICDVCDPQISRRGVQTAGDLAESMAALRSGKRRRRRRPIGAFISSLFLGGVLMWAGWEALHNSPWVENFSFLAPPDQPPAAPVKAFIKVTSTPDGADVINVLDETEMGKLIGRTPTDVLDRLVGETISLRILREGYQPYEVTTVVPASAAEEPLVISALLKVYAPPSLSEPWYDQLGVEYRPLGDDHESIGYVGESEWNAYAEGNKRAKGQAQVIEIEEAGEKRKVVVTSASEARSFCDWLVDSGVVLGYLTGDHEALARFPEKFRNSKLSQAARKKGWRPFRVLVRMIPYGRVMLRTDPPGADIYLDGVVYGMADGPLLIDGLRPGNWEVTASLEGYKSETRKITVKPKQTHTLEIKMRENKSVILDRDWQNSLGMKFVPVGEDWMVAIWETRIRDFRAYAREIDGRMPSSPDFFPPSVGTAKRPSDEHPVVSISREEAEAFCQWLTEKERAEERLTRSLEYRLPTDQEWSFLAGLQEVVGASPARRDIDKPKVFFWGTEWPPPTLVGNLADQSSGMSPQRQIADYNDTFPVTAPVGSFSPNPLGIFDLCGNAQEWVKDSYSLISLDGKNGVLRGGGWMSYQKKDLYIGARNPQPPTASEVTYGFRVVLAKKRSEPEETEEPNEEDNG